MAIRKFKPTTPGQRNKAISAFDEITTNKPQKSLLAPLKRTGGRNNTGQMTMLLQRFLLSSTILTVVHVSHSYSTKMVRSVISSLLPDLR